MNPTHPLTGWPARLCRLLALALLLCFGTLASAQGRIADSFDHLRTGFPLTGLHTKARCEACHTGGQFKGTPRDCAACHQAGQRLSRGNVVMPARHMPSSRSCDNCHRTDTFAGVRFNHAGVTAGSCLSCHNAAFGAGKPAAHVATTASCDSCHRTTAWLPATGFDHAGVAAGTCGTCHNGSRAAGLPPAHVPVATLPVAAAACDSCHKGSFSTWANGRLHANVSVVGGCTTCHTGGFTAAVGKPVNATHATVTGNCESCHKSTTTWLGAKVDHGTFTVATNCSTCHNNSAATGKAANHVPVGATNCIACHTTTTWKPSSFNHTQVPAASQCATCHTGAFAPADGKPTNHVPYQAVPLAATANCDACHKGSVTTWANGVFHSVFSVTTGCFTCHTGAYGSAVGKPLNATHATVTGNCESCHKSTTTWLGAKVDHGTFTVATNCSTCHNNSAATGKAANHVPVGATNCIACHTTTTWKPSSFNHTQVTTTAQCASCHTGAFPPADGKPTNHVPYQAVAVTAAANCDACHKGSVTTWANGKVHSVYALTTQCFSCHTGAYGAAVGKPANSTHATVVGNCESCHKSTTSWTSGVVFAHTAANAVGTGTCDTCHNGTTAKGKSTTHVPVNSATSKCDSCHRSQSSFATAVTMNHTVVATATCKSCHNGAYTGEGTTGALAKTANHIPEVQLLNGAAMDCNACHTSTTAWTTLRMNHNASMGNGAGWCKGCHTSGTAYAGGMERKSLTHEKSTGVTDCSQSGCHRPLGTKGAAYTKWD